MLIFEKMAALWKFFFLVRKSWKVPCNSNNFQHIEKILRTSVDNSLLQIPSEFQVDRINIFRVLLLAELKNFVLRKTRLKVKCSYLLSKAFEAESFNFENKIFLGTRPCALHFWITEVHFKQKNCFLQILHERYPLSNNLLSINNY